MSLADDLFLILARGIPRADLVPFRKSFIDKGVNVSALKPAELERHWLAWRGPRPSRVGSKIVFCASRRDVAHCGKRLNAAGIQPVWQGEREYPAKIADGLGKEGPPWLLLRGTLERFAAQQVGMIGSRSTPGFLCQAASNLARALADQGIIITSGMAAGADSAAHEGALSGEAGTIGVPARGVFQAGEDVFAHAPDRFGLVGIARPAEGFNGGLAIRRNEVIAALSDAVVLAATGLGGGSSYVLRWAIRHHRPIWCFECGDRTPEGNASLLRAGLARPLPLGEASESLAAAIIEGLGSPGVQPRRRKSTPAQLDWLS